MKKFVKAMALVMAAALMTVSFAACGGPNYGLVSDGKLIMGTNAEFPPFESLENDKVVGVDASIMEKVAEKLGLTLEIKNMEFDSLPSALTGKTIDVIAAGFTVNAEREENMDFTDSYYTAQQTIIVKKDSSYAGKDDLTGKKVGVQSGTTGDLYSAPEIKDVQIVKFNNGALAVQALLMDSVDAVIIDNNPAKAYYNEHTDKLKLIEKQFDPEDYAIAVSKGNKALQEAINKALKEMKSDGSLKAILDEFIK